MIGHSPMMCEAPQAACESLFSSCADGWALSAYLRNGDGSGMAAGSVPRRGVRILLAGRGGSWSNRPLSEQDGRVIYDGKRIEPEMPSREEGRPTGEGDNFARPAFCFGPVP